jgi:signal transduction histidine kinase/signal recognition particle receptor subunit beta
MSLINVRDKTINAKIVYYGTALSGKTTSLKYVHRVIDPERRIELVSLNTEGDRTLFFDFLPIALGSISGYQVKLQAFTVPGQVKYNLTRRYVLRGADAVIFVADSRSEAFEDNVKSLVTLRENLEANSLDPEGVPLVLQYNKRDAPNAAPAARLRTALNSRAVPDFQTIATTGNGVFEAFTELCSGMMSNIAREYRIGDPVAARDVLRERLAALGRTAAARSAPTPPVPSPEPTTGVVWASAELVGSGADMERTDTIIEVAKDGDDDTPDVEKLLERAVDTHIASAELVTELNEVKHRLGDHVKQLAALHETGVVVSSELNGDRLLKRILDASLRTVGSSLGSVLLVGDGGDSLVERMVQGFSRDPLARGGRTDPGILQRVLERRAFQIELARDGSDAAPGSGADAPLLALVAPLVHQTEVLGAIVAYLPTGSLDHDVATRLRFLTAIASQAAVALENSRLFARVETLNRDLERKVAERTRELEQACRDLQVLDRLKDDFLSSMSHELLTPLTSISSFAEILAGIAGDPAPASAAERTEFSTIIHREAARLTEMVQTLLDLSRIEAGKVDMTAGALDLKECLLASYQRNRPSFVARDISVRLLVDEGMAPARADSRWIARVFDALLSNAAKFAPEGTEVHVAIRHVGDAARIDVRDRGAGIPEHLRAVIFDKFKQLGDILTDKPPGLGLGLPMARAILERQGGTIWYEPARSGGSIFAFTLPLGAAAPAELR